MPLLSSHNYQPPFLLRNGHVNTLYANLLRKGGKVKYQRERIATNDGDFLDLDWQQNGNYSLLLLVHGLEGNAQAPYMRSMANIAHHNGWDVCAMNLRGCGGTMNRLFSMYHSGKTDDFEAVISHIQSNSNYNSICLVGFSLGGNLVLKYIGEQAEQLPSPIKGFAGISVTFDLRATAYHLARLMNFPYEFHLLSSLKRKLKIKAAQYPEMLSSKVIRKIRDFEDFDNLYTAPAHGFKDAYDYWHQNSCKHFLTDISVPGLIINALDDPIIPNSTYPVSEAGQHRNLHLETPKYGGHVGFVQRFKTGHPLYHEQRIMTFFKDL